MVVEIRSPEKCDEIISKNRLVVIAVCSNDRNNSCNYALKIMQMLESMATPTIVFAITNPVNMVHRLEDYELRIAERDVLIKMYLDGRCVFSQEGMFHDMDNDIEILKSGIKSTLSRYSIRVKFVKRS